MSRFSGCWVAFKALGHRRTSATVDRPGDAAPSPPDFALPPTACTSAGPTRSCARSGTALMQATRSTRPGYARQRLDQLMVDAQPRARASSSGRQELPRPVPGADELGIDEAQARALGLRVYKVGMVAARATGARRSPPGSRGGARRRGEAPDHRVPAEGDALQLADGRAPRARQVRRDRRVARAADRAAAADRRDDAGDRRR